jgi:hypothetical protein
MASSFVRWFLANSSYYELALLSKPTSFGTDTENGKERIHNMGALRRFLEIRFLYDGLGDNSNHRVKSTG